MNRILIYFIIQFTALLFLLLQIPKQATAQDYQEATAYKGWRVTSFTIEGIDEKLAANLKKGLSIPNLFPRFRRRGPIFYPQALLDDIERTRLYLARRGYPYASINPKFEPYHSGKKFSLILEIVAGPPVWIESITIEGLPVTLDGEAVGMLGFSTGSVFSEEHIETAASSIKDRLQQAGFARARVERNVERIDSTSVKIAFRTWPGDVYRFGNTIVEGVSTDLIPLVRKIISVKRGTMYSPLVLERAHENLRLLDLFRKIRLSTAEAGADTLDLTADLSSRKPRAIEIGIGYWTDGQVRVRIRWLHRNLFRAGRGLSVGTSASRYLQTADLSFWWPALIGARTREALSAKIESQREDSYNLISVGGELSTSYRHSYATTTRLSIDISNVDVTVKTETEEAFIEEGGLLTVLAMRWTRNATDNRLYPTRGSLTWAKTQWAPNGFLSDNHFASLETSASLYLPLSTSIVLANRTTIGLAAPTGGSKDLLPNKRFYAGGANSMRGFERRKLGPLDAVGAPLGGEAKLEASIELRAPLVWRFRWAFFLDAGQVWRTIDDMGIHEMEVAVGPGLMLRTPVGPIRVDLGRRLTDREKTQPRWVFHLSIGHPF